jgi:hypothetical protein
MADRLGVWELAFGDEDRWRNKAKAVLYSLSFNVTDI